MIRRVAGLAVAAALATCTGTTPPHSTAQRVGKLEQTIGGPHAIGQVGDWILENDQVRFVIADKGVGRVNTTFGGTLVDADLQRVGGDDRGNDELAEFTAGVRVHGDQPDQRLRADALRRVPDPRLDRPARRWLRRSSAAQIMVTGVGGDLLEMVYRWSTPAWSRRQATSSSRRSTASSPASAT